jgi:hypothetical protein
MITAHYRLASHWIVSCAVRGCGPSIVDGPVAILVPPGSAAAVDTDAFVQSMREFRKANRLDELSIRELIDEGRR